MSFTAIEDGVANTLGFILAAQGPFESNQLAGLATASGLASEDFTTTLELDADTSFSLAIDGRSTGLLTIPGSAASPLTYDKPEDLINAIVAQIDADGAFQAQPATTALGQVLVAGTDFSAENRAFSLSLDGGTTRVDVVVDGDSAAVSFGGETPGTLANALAAVQDAIDATALNGQVIAALDGNDNLYLETVSAGANVTLDVVADGSGAQFTGSSALNGAGFDFSSSNASFDISIDNETPLTVTLSAITSDRDETVSALQDALDAAGIGNRVTASLDGSDQLVLTRSSANGATTGIEISNSNATALAELGLSDSTVNGLDGFSLAETEYAGLDSKSIAINYAYDADTQLGRLVFSSDDQSDVIEFDDVSINAINKLGVFVGDGTVTTARQGTDVEGKINGIDAVGSGQYLRASSGNIPARPGFYLNTTIGNLAGSTTNDTFTVVVDGVSSGPITLGTIANTNPDAVAATMEAAINNNPLVFAAGVGVTVDYDQATGGFGIISRTAGSTSSVTISQLSGNAASIFGFAIGAGANGKVGTAAQGEVDASADIRVQILGGSEGERGSVSFVRGVADQLDTLLDSFLGSNGLLTNKTDSLNDELAEIDEERADLETRLQRSEERLRSSFLANDLIISNLNSQSDFLSSQLRLLENLVSSRSNDDS